MMKWRRMGCTVYKRFVSTTFTLRMTLHSTNVLLQIDEAKGVNHIHVVMQMDQRLQTTLIIMRPI